MNYIFFSVGNFFPMYFLIIIFFPSKSVCKIFFPEITYTPLQKSNGRPRDRWGEWMSLVWLVSVFAYWGENHVPVGISLFALDSIAVAVLIHVCVVCHHWEPFIIGLHFQGHTTVLSEFTLTELMGGFPKLSWQKSPKMGYILLESFQESHFWFLDVCQYIEFKGSDRWAF